MREWIGIIADFVGAGFLIAGMFKNEATLVGIGTVISLSAHTLYYHPRNKA